MIEIMLPGVRFQSFSHRNTSVDQHGVQYERIRLFSGITYGQMWVHRRLPLMVSLAEDDGCLARPRLGSGEHAWKTTSR